MNDFEQKLLQEIHDIRVDFTEMKGDLKEVKQDVKNNGEKFDDQTATETKRLDKHSNEIDDLRDGYSELKTRMDNNWKWMVMIATICSAVGALAVFFIK